MFSLRLAFFGVFGFTFTSLRCGYMKTFFLRSFDKAVGPCEHIPKLQRSKCPEHQEDRKQHAEVADTVGDHRFHRRAGVRPTDTRIIEPETDQEVAAQPYQFPSHEEHQIVVARHKDEHRSQEQAEVSEELGIALALE